MSYWVHIVLAVLYYGIGYRLTHLAFRHYTRVDPRPGHRYDAPNFTDIYEPDNFAPEGQRARLTAVHYWWVGFAALVLLLLFTR